jgi:hypothetical protein
MGIDQVSALFPPHLGHTTLTVGKVFKLVTFLSSITKPDFFSFLLPLLFIPECLDSYLHLEQKSSSFLGLL